MGDPKYENTQNCRFRHFTPACGENLQLFFGQGGRAGPAATCGENGSALANPVQKCEKSSYFGIANHVKV
jgi:hypothetical protein